MGKLTDDMTRLVDEIQTLHVSRDNFIKGIQDETRQFIKDVRNEFIGGIQDVVKQKASETRQFLKDVRDGVKHNADETRQFLKEFRNDMNGAHEAFFGR